MPLNNSTNNGNSSIADGFAIKGGTTSVRQLTLTGGDIIVSASGSNVYTFPTATGTLANSAAISLVASVANAGKGLYNYVTVSISVSTTNATTFSNIANLSVAVSTGNIYRGEAFLAVRFGTSTAINQFAMTFPAMTFLTGIGTIIYGGAPIADSFSTTYSRVGPINAAGSGSAVLSTGGVSLNVSTPSPIKFEWICQPSANGSIQIQAGVSAGTATTVYAGSYIRVWKIN